MSKPRRAEIPRVNDLYEAIRVDVLSSGGVRLSQKNEGDVVELMLTPSQFEQLQSMRLDLSERCTCTESRDCKCRCAQCAAQRG